MKPGTQATNAITITAGQWPMIADRSASHRWDRKIDRPIQASDAASTSANLTRSGT